MKVLGNIELNQDASGEIRNAFIERVTDAQEQALQQQLAVKHSGRLFYNKSQGRVKMWLGSYFETLLVTADNTSAVRLDRVIDTFGGLITADGQFDASALVGTNLSFATSTDVIDVLRVIDGAIQSINEQQMLDITLDELIDVDVASATSEQLLRYNGASWTPTWLTLADLQDVTVTSETLEFLENATGNIQEQIDSLVNRFARVDSALITVEPDVTFTGAVVHQVGSTQLFGTFAFTSPLTPLPKQLALIADSVPVGAITSLVPITCNGEPSIGTIQVDAMGFVRLTSTLTPYADPEEDVVVTIDTSSVVYLSN